MQTATVQHQDQGRMIGVVGDVYRFLATGDETDGKYALFEAQVPPGGGPPPHVHSREVEAFYVLDGEITFLVGSEQILATAGMFVHIPIGCEHAFRNTSSRPARMLIEVVPAGLERMFFEVGQPITPGDTAAQPTTPADIEKLLEAAPRYGVEIRLPPH